MASNEGPSENASVVESDPPPRTIVLHVLSPSLDAPNRLTFNELPLTTRIADLKGRIMQCIPSRPGPEKQRLIYRGKPLSDDGATLQNILEPPEAPVHSMHLVLPPSPTPSGVASAPAAPSTPVQEQLDAPRQINPLQPPGPYQLYHHTQHNQGIRFRGPLYHPPTPNESEIELALRRNIEALRRQIELQEQGRWQPRQHGSHVPTSTGRFHQLSNPLTSQSFPPSTSRPNILQRTPSNLSQQSAAGAASTAMSSGTDSGRPTVAAVPAAAHMTRSQTSEQIESRRSRFQQLQQQVAFMESQLSLGLAPQIDLIARIRTELYSLLDDQFRTPVAPRDGHIEALLARVLNIYMRADQIRVLQSRSPPLPQSGDLNAAVAQDSAQAPLYLLSSPTGHHSLIASPNGAAAIESWLAARRLPQTSPTVPVLGQGHPQGPQPNPGALVMENAVRQALMNQRVQHNRQATFARNARRAWLFIRLYFFCYLFSESGTWSRVIFVSFAVLISLLSETGLPQQIQRVVIGPVQRHLESLVHVGNEQIRPLNPRGRDGVNAQRNGPDMQTNAGQDIAAPIAEHVTGQSGIPPGGLQQSLRRVERSLALFFASLVPGVGERHVEVRNAAEAALNAERARREEDERRRREDAEAEEAGDAQQPAEEQPPLRDSPERNHPADTDTRIPPDIGVGEQ